MRTLCISSVLLLLVTAAPRAQDPAALPTDLLTNQKFLGDFEAMKKRRLIRVGVAYNRSHYFIDKGVQRGLTYESFKLFEDELNAAIKQAKDRINVVFIPMSRDEMAKALLEGRVDVLAANLTITPERRKLVDFSNPVRSDVAEIVVTGPDAPPIKTKADLAGKEVFVRERSTYHQHLLELNGRLKTQGLAEVRILLAPQSLEDDDILEMVNAGLAEITVVDNFLAEFWKQVFTEPDAAPQRGADRERRDRRGDAPRTARR